MGEDAVVVVLRIRPLLGLEAGHNKIISIPTAGQAVLEGAKKGQEDHSFTYDHVFGEETDQYTVYDTCVTPLLDKFLQGYNATILAYGQTGSGKTYSMGTDGRVIDPDQLEAAGIVPHIASDLFKRLASKGCKSSVGVQFLEVYGETIRDLLNTEPDAPEPQIREAVRGEVSVTGCREVTVCSPLQVCTCSVVHSHTLTLCVCVCVCVCACVCICVYMYGCAAVGGAQLGIEPPRGRQYQHERHIFALSRHFYCDSDTKWRSR